MTTKFRIPKDQAMGTVKWMWDVFVEDLVENDEKAQNILEDLPVSHTKQLVNFFHFCASVGDKSLTRNNDDLYEPSEGVT